MRQDRLRFVVSPKPPTSGIPLNPGTLDQVNTGRREVEDVIVVSCQRAVRRSEHHDGGHFIS